MTTTIEPPPKQRPPLATEIILVLAFAYLPTLLTSLSYLMLGADAYPKSGITPFRQLAYVLPMAQISIPLLYIYRLRHGEWSLLGFRRPKWSDLALGLAAFCAAFLLYYAVMMVFYGLAPSAYQFAAQQSVHVPYVGPKSILDYSAIAIAAIAIGFGEELLFRAYLISRWQQLSGSTLQAILLSTLLFSLNHAYEGLYGVMSKPLIGVAYALFFVKFRRLWPIAFAHALTDFLLLARM